MEPTSIVIPQLWTISRYHPTRHPGCLGWSVHFPPPDILLVHHFHGKYSINTLYLYHTISAKESLTFSIEGDSINVISMVDFWIGGVDQRLFGLSAAVPPKKPKRVTPIETLGVFGSPTSKNRVTGRVKQQRTKMITSVINTSPGAQCTWN